MIFVDLRSAVRGLVAQGMATAAIKSQVAQILKEVASPQQDLVRVPAVNRFKKPGKQEIACAAQEMSMMHAHAEEFFDYYESNGWRVGRSQMKDWRAALRNWHRRSSSSPTSKPSKYVITQQIKECEQAIQRHPANVESVRYNPNFTNEQRDELDEFRVRLCEFRKQLVK